jgi:peptidoglycan/xylan/chitin deacetylase (PgdA/CDA1 family)
LTKFSRLLAAGVALALALAPGSLAESSGGRPERLAPQRLAPTVVSVEFDHAFTDQLPAIALANRLGMKLTVFAMSGRLGHPGYMTTPQLLGVQSAGNEVGGHTIDHPDLPLLSAQAQRHEICDDRAALLADGLRVTDFAYPYGDFAPATPRIVRECGYESARTAGGLAAASGCGGPCQGPAAETIPPAHPFETRSANSVLSSTSLATIERYVTAAQHAGGGWVQIVFHYVCADCDLYSVDPQTLATFFEWLAKQRSVGTKEETVYEVLTTPFRPGVLAVSAGHRTVRLRPVKRCPATPVRTSCTVSASGRVAVLRVASGQRLFLRTDSEAESLRFEMHGVVRRAKRVGGDETARLLWRLFVPARPKRGLGMISVREALGSATYTLRLDPLRAGTT